MFHLSPDKDSPFTVSLVKTAASHLLNQQVKGIFFGKNTFLILHAQFYKTQIICPLYIIHLFSEYNTSLGYKFKQTNHKPTGSLK